MDFKTFYNKGISGEMTRHRHRNHGFTDTHKTYRRKSLNLVPDMFKKDASKNEKIEKLKEHPGTVVCSPIDMKYILDTFRVTPSKNEERKLGSTGITLRYEPNYKNFILTNK